MKKSKISVIVSWLLVVLVAAFIFYMSSKQSTGMGGGIIGAVREFLISILAPIFGPDVDVSPIGHYGEFFVFGATLLNALRHHLDLKATCIGAVVLASLYGASDEFHQLFVPTRSSDPMDWLVDTLAALTVALIFYAIMRNKKPSQKTSLV